MYPHADDRKGCRKGCMEISVDPDQRKPADPDLHCFQKKDIFKVVRGFNLVQYCLLAGTVTRE